MVSHAKKKRLDFDDPNSLTDEDIVNLIGITKEQFEFLVSSVSKLKKSANRSPRTAIAILLVKLKTGLSHSIVQHMMRSNDENMMKWFKKDDILILDRGFRDALEFLHACGFQTESPAFLPKSAKQFSTEDANLSRPVTKIRWTVESVNARI
ncbi:unnamed protein product [Mytilus coruscus]|uniref:DDE Tnp4 domain-containing protein n=1 Tax=Mytilus coruscus TaxID=42192 RepID=A0A6J8DJ81_MYTCO|nr:unnamed protein product [Mytilus coruscus]